MCKITGVLVNPDAKTAEKASIEKSLDSYYKTLDCSCIDIVCRRIGGMRFDIICDDEGTFKADPFISAIDPLGSPMLVGRLFIVKFDGEEDVRSLTDKEAEFVLRHVRVLATRKHPDPYPMIVCNY